MMEQPGRDGPALAQLETAGIVPNQCVHADNAASGIR